MTFELFKSRRPRSAGPGRLISYLLVFGSTAVLFFLLHPHMRQAVDLLAKLARAYPPDKAAGILLSVIASCVTFIYVAISQNRRRSGNVTRYRFAEEKLLEKKHLSQSDILTYHSQYNWDVYASISFSTLLLIVSFLFTAGSGIYKEPIDYLIVFLSLLFLSAASVMLAVVDVFHTNTLSPLITRKKRFELIDIIIKIGSFSIVLQVCAITIFLTLVNAWLSIAISLLALWSVVFFSGLRGVPVDALAVEYQLSEAEADEIWRL